MQLALPQFVGVVLETSQVVIRPGRQVVLRWVVFRIVVSREICISVSRYCLYLCILCICRFAFLDIQICTIAGSWRDMIQVIPNLVAIVGILVVLVPWGPCLGRVCRC